MQVTTSTSFLIQRINEKYHLSLFYVDNASIRKQLKPLLLDIKRLKGVIYRTDRVNLTHLSVYFYKYLNHPLGMWKNFICDVEKSCWLSAMNWVIMIPIVRSIFSFLLHCTRKTPKSPRKQVCISS